MKRTISLTLALLLLCTLFASAIPVSADTEGTQRESSVRSDYAFLLYFDGYSTETNRLTADGTTMEFHPNCRITPAESGKGIRVPVNAGGLGLDGMAAIRFAKFPVTAATADTSINRYLILRYRAVQVSAEFENTDQTATFFVKNADSNIRHTYRISNGVWKTEVIDLNDNSNYDNGRTAYYFRSNQPAAICFPGLNAEAYYEVDYMALVPDAAFAEGTLSMPTVPDSCKSGTYNSSVTVSLAHILRNTPIYYTTDGSVPSRTNGTRYTEPLVLTESATVKALAVRDGFSDSDVLTLDYTVSSNMAFPVTFNYTAGKVCAGSPLTMTSLTPDAKIYYTADGSDPDAATGTLYTEPVTLRADVRIRAVAVAQGKENSAVTEAEFKVVQPIWWRFNDISPETEAYTAQQNVYKNAMFRFIYGSGTMFNDAFGGIVLSGNESGLRIRWNEMELAESNGIGARPNANFRYAKISYRSDADFSLIFNPGEGSVDDDRDCTPVPIAKSEAYTTVVIDLLQACPKWAEFTDGAGTTNLTFRGVSLSTVGIAYIAFFGDEASARSTDRVSVPVFSLESDTYTTVQQVTLTCSTEGASIYYTTDGSEPSAENGILYTAPITVDKTVNIRAVAIKDGMTASSVTERSYVIQLTAARPEFSLKSGKYTGEQTVTMTCSTEGASIYYTTDGSEPSASNGTRYTSPVALRGNTVLKAVAVCEGMADSKIATANYSITVPATEAQTTANEPGTAGASEKPSGGCSSGVGMASVLLLLLPAGMLIRRKKET